MDFTLNEETKMLQSNAAKFIKEKSPGSAVKNFLKEEKGFSEAVWKEMAGLGWLGLVHGEAYGGSGGDFFDLFILFEEMGGRPSSRARSSAARSAPACSSTKPGTSG